MLWIEDLFSLIFPRICACCGNSLWKHEEIVCTSCKYHLPKTGFHLERDNPVARVFWGRVPIESAAAYLYFNKGSRVQQLVHQLKYKDRKDVGIWLGKQYGHLLRYSPFFDHVDLIIPVPLHKKKIMKRGYNQSEQFAIGLSESMKIPMEARILVRGKHTETQTKKSRFSRWENVKDIFLIEYPEKLTGRHVLLVDDVITTGATLESCLQCLLNVTGTRASVATIATALL